MPVKTILTQNFILRQDSYKSSHFKQIPKKVKRVQSTIVARKPSKYVKRIVVAGTQYLARYLASVTITEEDVLEAEIENQEQGYEFNKEGWMRIVNECGGKLPLRVRALA